MAGVVPAEGRKMKRPHIHFWDGQWRVRFGDNCPKEWVRMALTYVGNKNRRALK